MRSSILMVVAGAALLMAAPQFASAAPMTNGANLKAAADTASAVKSIHYYRRYGGYGYGGYGYRGYYGGGYGYRGGYGYGY
jgi:hypothetical protein